MNSVVDSRCTLVDIKLLLDIGLLVDNPIDVVMKTQPPAVETVLVNILVLCKYMSCSNLLMSSVCEYQGYLGVILENSPLETVLRFSLF